MKTIIDRASSRGYANHGWLETYHTFSFAEYYNPKRMHFGALRVLNDDVVAPGRGFDTHPHKNMEVITIPLQGFLRHGDSLKSSEVITRGQIQLMSTGSGIYHSEYNDSHTDHVEFLQIWVIPQKNDTPPKYENHDIRPLIKHNQISTFLAPDTEISMLQDVWFSWAPLDKGLKKKYKFHAENTGVYVFVVEGRVKIGDATLGRRDGMGITETSEFTIEAHENCEVLLIEVIV